MRTTPCGGSERGKEDGKCRVEDGRGICVKRREGARACMHDFWQHCHLNSTSGTEPGFTAGLQLRTNYYLTD